MFSGARRLPFVLLLLLGLTSQVLMSACSPTETPTKCQKDNDCKETEFCSQGVCTPRQRCSAATASVVCKPTETCKNSICVPKKVDPPKTECQTDLDCTDNKRCNTALGKCVECVDNSNCSNGQVCRGNVCTKEDNGEPTPDQDNRTKCSTDADCLALDNHTCDLIEGVCVPRGGKTCTKDDECPGNQRCDGGTCTIGRRDCSSDPSVCQSGYECRANNCYRKTCKDNNDCETDKKCNKSTGKCGNNSTPDCTKTGCPTGKVCNRTTKLCQDNSLGCSSDGECKANEKCNTFTGKCEPKSGCSSDSECNSNQRCSNGKCVPKTGPCTKDGDCPSGTKCFSGTCRVGCRSNSDCASGQKCNLGTNQCQTSSCTSDSQCTPPVGACYQGKCQSCASQFNCPSTANCNFSTGRCEPKPQTCSNDAQCSSPNGSCQGGKCVNCATAGCPSGQQCNRTTGRCAAARCTRNSQCTSTQYCKSGTCTAKQCDPATGQKCSNGRGCVNFECTGPKTCRTNVDCQFTEYCKSGTCTRKQCDTLIGLNCPSGQQCVNYTCTGSVTKKRSKCSSILKNCPSGHVCLTTNKGDYCYRTCTNKGGKCSGGDDCLEVTLGDGSKKNYCFFPPSRTTGQVCEDLDTRCKTGSFCIFDNRAAKSGKCWKECPSASSTTCGSTQVCSPVSDTDFACLPKGSGRENSTCRTTSLRCGESFFCFMTSSTATSGKCIPRCSRPGSQSTCKTNYECLAIYANSTKNGACLPAANRTVGQSCGGTTGLRCKSGLTCTLLTSGAKTGSCLKNCKSSTDCRTGTGSSLYRRCVSLSSGGGVCYR